MILLTLRTDKPDAELGIYRDTKQLAYHVWPAHRALAETIHIVLQQQIEQADLRLQEVDGLVLYQGPGSFTGLRIGASVANALADSLQIPLVGVVGDEQWIDRGIARLLAGENDTLIVPEYGAPVHITEPRK